MIYNIISSYDNKSRFYNLPRFEKGKVEDYVQETIRGLSHVSKEILTYARDNTLYLLGTYNDEDNTFDIFEKPEKLIDVSDYLPKEE